MEVEEQVASVDVGMQTIEVPVGNARDGYHRVRFAGRELGRFVGKPAPGVASEPNPHSGHFKPDRNEKYAWTLWATKGGRFALYFSAPGKPGGQLIIAESWGWLSRQFGVPEEVTAAVTSEMLVGRVVDVGA